MARVISHDDAVKESTQVKAVQAVASAAAQAIEAAASQIKAGVSATQGLVDKIAGLQTSINVQAPEAEKEDGWVVTVTDRDRQGHIRQIEMRRRS